MTLIAAFAEKRPLSAWKSGRVIFPAERDERGRLCPARPQKQADYVILWLL